GSVTVTAQDADGNTATGYRGTVYFTSSDTQAVLPVTYTFTAADAGVHAFSGSTLYTAGVQSLTATDTETASITGSQLGITVNQATPTTAITSSASTSTYGQSVTFTATVTPQYTGTPTGTVTFTVNSTPVATIALSGGIASFSTTMLPAGVHSISATYNGDG